MEQNLTEIGLQIANQTAYADIYLGTNSTVDPSATRLDALVSNVENNAGQNNTRAMLFVGNNNGDNSLDSNEKGYLVFHFAFADEPAENEHVYIQIRPENGAPLAVDFLVPSQTMQGWTAVGA